MSRVEKRGYETGQGIKVPECTQILGFADAIGRKRTNPFPSASSPPATPRCKALRSVWYGHEAARNDRPSMEVAVTMTTSCRSHDRMLILDGSCSGIWNSDHLPRVLRFRITFGLARINRQYPLVYPESRPNLRRRISFSKVLLCLSMEV